jgi:hypothetical protein
VAAGRIDLRQYLVRLINLILLYSGDGIIEVPWLNLKFCLLNRRLYQTQPQLVSSAGPVSMTMVRVQEHQTSHYCQHSVHQRFLFSCTACSSRMSLMEVLRAIPDAFPIPSFHHLMCCFTGLFALLILICQMSGQSVVKRELA